MSSKNTLEEENVARKAMVSDPGAFKRKGQHLESENIFLKKVIHELMQKTFLPLTPSSAKKVVAFPHPVPPVCSDFAKERLARWPLFSMRGKEALH